MRRKEHSQKRWGSTNTIFKRPGKCGRTETLVSMGLVLQYTFVYMKTGPGIGDEAGT